MKLYHYWRSSCSYRVRIALALKAQRVDLEAVHLARGEQHEADFVAHAPMHQVPLLMLPMGSESDVGLSQSMAIIDYLEQSFVEPSLFGEAPLERAFAIELAEMINAGIQPLQNLRMLQKLEKAGVDKMQWSREVMADGFAAFEARLAHCAGDYCVGDRISLADIFLVPQMYNARRFKLDLSPFPTTVEIDARCQQLPAFAAAHPDRQPDAPES